jgi:hypothetical protein
VSSKSSDGQVGLIDGANVGVLGRSTAGFLLLPSGLRGHIGAFVGSKLVGTTVFGSDVGECIWLGLNVGSFVDPLDGWVVGWSVGFSLGCCVGWSVGFLLGWGVGRSVGFSVGSGVGLSVGFSVGILVGSLVVGFPVGLFEGDVAGEAVGVLVGTPVGKSVGFWLGVTVGEPVLEGLVTAAGFSKASGGFLLGCFVGIFDTEGLSK